jgi:pimeloyl-ACP methyl ester carboxylesterase
VSPPSTLESDRQSEPRAAVSWALERLGARSRRVKTRDGLVHTFELGVARSGPPILWLHGLCGDAETLALYAACFADQRRSLVPDAFDIAPRSRRIVTDGPRTPFGPRRQAEALVRFLEAQRIREVDVVGVGLGAWTAVWLGATTSLVRRGVLVSPIGVDVDAQELAYARRLVDIDGVEALVSRVLSRPMCNALLTALRSEIEEGRVTELLDSLGEHDQIDGVLSELRAPFFVLAGGADDLGGTRSARRIVDRAPGARGAWVQAAAHCPFYRDPDIVGAALRRHLQIGDLETSVLGRRLFHADHPRSVGVIRRRRKTTPPIESGVIRAPTKSEQSALPGSGRPTSGKAR